MGDEKVRLRFPTLELYSALHGNGLSLGGRPLTTSEKKDAKFIFGSSIDLEKVRVVNALVANAPTTLGNFIRVGMDGKISRQTLIHELGHIWQFQTMGTGYISNSICKQVSAKVKTGSRNAAYTITKADLRKTSIYDLPAEKQATVIEIYFIDPKVRNKVPYKNYIKQVRSAKPLPEKIIQEEAAFGPGMGAQRMMQDMGNVGGSRDNAVGTVPLIRLEF